MAPPPQAHFLIVTYPSQGHVTPARHLARRLVHAGARATVCVPISAFSKMFPDVAADGGEVVDDGGGVAYAAYSDGYDGGFDRAADDHTRYMAQVRAVGSRTVATVLRRLRDGGRPVTCAVYTLLLPWVADVARRQGVDDAAVFWIQPTTALAAYYHYFRGHRDAVVTAAAASGDEFAEVILPGLPLLRVRDLPSFLAIVSDDDPFAFVLPEFESLIDTLERRDFNSGEAPTTYVLANTFDSMERDALASLAPHIDVVAVGPVLSFLHDATADETNTPNDLFDHDGGGYLAWLDTKPAKSVVYISFGSSSVMSKHQVAEIAAAMTNTNKPFLWVLRKDNCNNDDDATAIKNLVAAASAAIDVDGGEGGMAVAWCDQARVLAHPSVGCFVTHCGWNSTVEAVACGVPVVAAPQYSDQGTNAWLVERMGVGVRAAVRRRDGVLEAAEMRRCVEAVMASEAVAARAAAWKEEARAAVAAGGASERNLSEFVGRFMPK